MSQKTAHSREDAKDRIVKAARALFFAHGVSAVSTDKIAAEAKTSKMTMYKHFPTRNDIFRAVIDEECKRLYDPAMPLPETHDDYYDTFVSFGVNLLKFLNDPEIVRFDQLMIGQAVKHPETARFFYENAYEKTYKAVEEMIAHGQKHGFISSDEKPAFLSDVTLNALEGKAYQQGLYAMGPVKFTRPRMRAEKVLRITLGLQSARFLDVI